MHFHKYYFFNITSEFTVCDLCLVWRDGVPTGGQGQVCGEGPGPHQPAHLPQGQISQARGTVQTKRAKSVVRDLYPTNQLTFLRVKSAKHEVQ